MESPCRHDGNSMVSHHGANSRPSLGFPLGTALLLVVIFSLSGIFSCCYHWDKLRRTLNLDQPRDADDDLEQPTKHSLPCHMKKENKSVPVIMAGDNVPKFIAMPCPPCRVLPTEGKIVVQVQEPPLKPPPTIPVPSYV